jgi:hypothetical protein
MKFGFPRHALAAGDLLQADPHRLLVERRFFAHAQRRSMA